MGVSGGEVGALTGPSLMPGGQKEAFDKVSDILEANFSKSQRWRFMCCIHWTKTGGRSLCENGT
ncbi:6-phosphogluconate dehydrogenase [Staphylococcus gallinarum]|uniref:6-phosphogluconate dehydrogenase n=1 Tax=Staphylococcus gallinarum TaxID=1293 RepID=A0A380FHU0_STAGA|nr:6-phosphogluconate dehydrogenase [Staphylococcus gallinarum]